MFFDTTKASGLASPSENVYTLIVASDRAVYAGDGDTDAVYRLFDRNGDCDANDAGEATLWLSEANAAGFTLPTPNGLAEGPDGAISIVNAGVASRPVDSIYRTVDLDGDGLYTGAGETVVLASNADTPDALYRPRAVEFYEGPVQTEHTSLGAGNHFSLFLKDGVVHAAGENIVGQLGQGVTGFDIPATIPLTLPDGFAEEIVSVSAGQVHGTFLTASGDLYSWGLGNCGRLGLGDEEDRTTPAKIEGVLDDKTVVVATHGNGASYAITDDGTLHAWGQNSNAQLGLGDTTHRLEQRPT